MVIKEPEVSEAEIERLEQYMAEIDALDAEQDRHRIRLLRAAICTKVPRLIASVREARKERDWHRQAWLDEVR